MEWQMRAPCDDDADDDECFAILLSVHAKVAKPARLKLLQSRKTVRGFQGRHGLGNIYVWASGDGGEEDDCNCDGYAASMWTVSINSAINNGENAHYDESCSSTLASTFSNGAKDPHTGVVSVSRQTFPHIFSTFEFTTPSPRHIHAPPRSLMLRTNLQTVRILLGHYRSLRQMYKNSLGNICCGTRGRWCFRIGTGSKVNRTLDTTNQIEIIFKYENTGSVCLFVCLLVVSNVKCSPQSTADLERHSAFDCFDLKEELTLRCQKSFSLEDERRWIGIQSSVRIRCNGRWSDGRSCERMENCAAQIPLRSRLDPLTQVRAKSHATFLLTYSTVGTERTSSYNIIVLKRNSIFVPQKIHHQSVCDPRNRNNGLSRQRDRG